MQLTQQTKRRTEADQRPQEIERTIGEVIGAVRLLLDCLHLIVKGGALEKGDIELRRLFQDQVFRVVADLDAQEFFNSSRQGLAHDA
ncbi:MAG: hypothetical protein JW395_2763 [Nitrospira sp.]|nr:hypothetical protein [Nitrospira sp.]